MPPSVSSSVISSSSNYCWCRLYYATVLLLSAAASSSWTSEAFVVVAPAATTTKMLPSFFAPSPPPSSAGAAAKTSIAPLFAAPNNDNIVNEAATAKKKQQLLTHADITWKLRPPENTSKLSRLKIKAGANILRLYSKLKGKPLPPVLCPKGGRAMLEAYYKEPGLFQRKRRIGRFGFTTLRGPSNNEIDATIREVYQINPPPLSATIAAIIYMFVEPNYRHRNVGSLALSVISAIQSVQAVDFTVLVATSAAGGGNDDTLVQWYERNGYTKAPLLQDVMGSPDGKFGVTMIAPVGVKRGFFDECNLKWW